MSRLQLALNVGDLDEAVSFFSRLFATPPRKLEPGYANFAISDPPLKLVLFSGVGADPGTINHLGIEVESIDEVNTVAHRLDDVGLAVSDPGEEVCCFARQEKAWLSDPNGTAWEIYAVLEDVPAPVGLAGVAETPCCT